MGAGESEAEDSEYESTADDGGADHGSLMGESDEDGRMNDTMGKREHKRSGDGWGNWWRDGSGIRKQGRWRKGMRVWSGGKKG